MKQVRSKIGLPSLYSSNYIRIFHGYTKLTPPGTRHQYTFEPETAGLSPLSHVLVFTEEVPKQSTSNRTYAAQSQLRTAELLKINRITGTVCRNDDLAI